MATFQEGDRVWFRPTLIGYGYSYGVDYGIPAVVDAILPKLVRIVLTTKDGAEILTRVSARNLEPRP